MARSSKTRFAVLGMLTLRPMSGYELREEIAGSIGYFWSESFGQLYPTLRVLEADGLVIPERHAGEGRGRTTFAITRAGRDALVDWLGTEVESLTPDRNELLLKLFFARRLAPQTLGAHLSHHREALEAQHEQYLRVEAAVAADRSPDQPFWLATIRYGLAMTEAGLAWNRATTSTLLPDREGQHGSHPAS
ncbi:PadR family transcriptional regulator [Intrasporangium calvum]|uniref:PadR family transcriptional regulator n=1 Tax=Intrasporangium calvum TaxID=53358 RepID=A0ABT5GDQ9_9MICO|nr:PadR family transcriptional regulator [Intrasporangium calvum]MDC5695996.1 PadR family transcriptional regulator [Intrasporangium calvum]